MEYLAEETEYKGHTIKIYQDDIDVESPRDWDNLGTMACSHRRYNLGDVQVVSEEQFLAHALGGEAIERICYRFDNFPYYPSWWFDDTKDAMYKELDKRMCVMLPLYLYDHSGITMRVHPFADNWDSGQVGYIYVTKDQVRKEFNRKRITKKLRSKVEKILRQEVQTYDDYLTGNVWGYVIEDSEGEQVGSCWGFYGDWDYAIQEAKSEIDYMSK